MRFLAILALLAGVAAYASPEDDIVAGVSAAQMLDHIKYLSGATSDIDSRYSPAADTLIAQNWLKSYLEGLGYTTWLQNWGTYNGYACADNVIARKTGWKYPNQVYVICAHYDSVSNQAWTNAPGADDNASGAAAVLQAARLLRDYPTEYTIEFILFAGEEQWMLGSYYYCDHPEGRTWMGAINLDMIGYEMAPDTPLCIEYAGSPTLATIVNQASQYHNPGYPTYQYNYPSPAGDHWPFHAIGVLETALSEATPDQIWGGSNPHYHRTTDTWDHLSPNLLAVAARAGIGALCRVTHVSNGFATVLMPQYVGDLSNVTVSVERREPGSTVALETYMVPLDSGGAFEIPEDVPAGMWDFAVKAPGWLCDVSGSVSIPTMGAGFTLSPGDATGDNAVDLLDLNTILAAFGTAGSLGSDIDGSGMVDLVDLNLILTHFGSVGDE